MVATIPDDPFCALLIRPDGYMAWAAGMFEQADEDRLRSALRRWFGSEDTGVSMKALSAHGG